MGLFLVQTDKDMFINLLLIIAIKLQKGKIRLDGLMMLILSTLYSIWQMFILVCHILRT